MSFDADEEILQDFLVEAGEILEQLSEQLVDLEQRPHDSNLLNSIFRGFHTVKGGAGFLQLTPLVECCHVAENVFDIMRNGQRELDSDLMDTVLQALDAVNEMFDTVRAGSMPANADPALIERLNYFAKPQSQDIAAAAEAAEPLADSSAEMDEEEPELEPAVSVEANAATDEEISEDEFDALLDQLEQQKSKASATQAPTAKQPAAPVSGNDDEITDDEFENLLDQLHGPGSFSTSALTPTTSESPPPVSEAVDSDDDEITDDEFEALLDQLHGPGKFAADKAAAEPSPPEAKAPPPIVSADKKAESEPKKAAPKTEPAAPAAKTEKPVAKPAPEKTSPAPAPAAAKAPMDTEKVTVVETTVRVDTKRLDDIMNMVGELVLVRNRLVRIGGEKGDEILNKAVANLDVVTTDLQNSVMKTRMQPIKKVFGRFPRVVRDLARMLKKEVNLELLGEETDLDKNLVEALSDPLVHLVRNSVDHGIEMPDVRAQKGKPRAGKVLLSAEQEGDHILLRITDDGAGMDPNKLRQIAVQRGLFDAEAADRLTDKDCYALIFAPGFSTKTEISDVSGRGVGMDVVKTRISQLNGSVDIDSELGVGTRISIKVPLTLAIMPTLMVMLQNQAFALPLVNVDEIFNLKMSHINVVDGRRVALVRGRTLPLFQLGDWLLDPSKVRPLQENDQVVVVSIGNQKVGFVVDALVGQEEVVIKPLGKMLQGTEGMAGATITGDGSIALILDVPSLLKRYA